MPAPTLRPACPRPARTSPGGPAWFQWYLCPGQGPFCHLVLLDGPALLAHWVLPAAGPHQAVAPQLAGLWTHVPPTLALAVPGVAQAIGRGTCRAVGARRVAGGPAAGLLPARQLLLHLPTAGPAGVYILRQLA